MSVDDRAKDTEEGYFWIPGKEDQKITGDLIISEDEGISLNVKGCFFADDLQNEIVKVIFGQTISGETITFFECYRLNSNGINFSTINSNYDIGMAIDVYGRKNSEVTVRG